MAFMEPQMTEKQKWVEVENANGITHCPENVFNFAEIDELDLVHGVFIRSIEGYGVRLSAPGYLDCTDWDVFLDEKEAKERYQELVQEQKDEDAEHLDSSYH